MLAERTTRDSWEIAYAILQSCRTENSKSHIIQSANLCYTALDSYLDSLVDHRLLAEYINNEGGRRFLITPCGLYFMELFEKIQELI